MKLGEVIRRWRQVTDMPTKELAREIGIAQGTLSRVERGEQCDGKTLARILNWLMRET